MHTKSKRIGDSTTAIKLITEPTGNKKYLAGVKLIKGDKYYYTFKTAIETNLEVNEKEIESNNQSEIGLIYEVVKDSANTFLVKITYDKLHLSISKTDAETQEYDANRAADTQDRMDKLLSDIRGSSIMILLNGKGEILSSSGNQEIMDKIMAPMANESLESKKKVGEFVSRLTGQTFIEENLKEGFKVLPVNGFHVGDSWSNKSTQSADLKFEVNSTYTLSSIEDGIATITVKGKINNVNNTKTRFMDQDVTASLDGTQSAELEIDVSSGLVMFSKATTSITGDLQLLGRNVPVKIKVKKESKARKM